MNLSELLGPDRIRVPLRSRDKEDVLRELVGLLPSASDEDRLEQILEAVVEREKRMSTGIGKGVAIPHGRSLPRAAGSSPVRACGAPRA